MGLLLTKISSEYNYKCGTNRVRVGAVGGKSFADFVWNPRKRQIFPLLHNLVIIIVAIGIVFIFVALIRFLLAGSGQPNASGAAQRDVHFARNLAQPNRLVCLQGTMAILTLEATFHANTVPASALMTHRCQHPRVRDAKQSQCINGHAEVNALRRCETRTCIDQTKKTL